jgi:hypothetical protein
MSIRDHEINAANASITIEADEPTQGNSSHVYTVTAQDGTVLGVLRFQNGPINASNPDGSVVGVNGLTHEVLLAIILDRLRGFQTSKFSTRENSIVITKLEEALQWLHWRTRARVARGVEGTHTP